MISIHSARARRCELLSRRGLYKKEKKKSARKGGEERGKLLLLKKHPQSNAEHEEDTQSNSFLFPLLEKTRSAVSFSPLHSRLLLLQQRGTHSLRSPQKQLCHVQHAPAGEAPAHPREALVDDVVVADVIGDATRRKSACCAPSRRARCRCGRRVARRPRAPGRRGQQRGEELAVKEGRERGREREREGKRRVKALGLVQQRS